MVVTLCSSRCLSLYSWPQFLHFNSLFRRLFITISSSFFFLFFSFLQFLSIFFFFFSLSLWVYSCGLCGPSGPYFHTHLRLLVCVCLCVFFFFLNLASIILSCIWYKCHYVIMFINLRKILKFLTESMKKLTFSSSSIIKFSFFFFFLYIYPVFINWILYFSWFSYFCCHSGVIEFKKCCSIISSNNLLKLGGFSKQSKDSWQDLVIFCLDYHSSLKAG